MRILYVCHNHPAFHPGGTEIFAHDLFTEVKRSGAAEALFLACTNRIHRDPKPGTNFQTVGRSADEIVLWAGHFDRFYQSQVDLHGVVPELSSLLLQFRPDIVHIHHTLLFGVEMLFLIRRLLPSCRIVYTLHDYYPICPHEGLMVTTGQHALCRTASPDACHRCFPETSPDKFVLRRQHLRHLLSLVDLFLAPSRFLRDRYIAWGLPAERLVVLRNGRPATQPVPHRARPDHGTRNAFAFLGNLNPFKGIRVALHAVRLLKAQGLEVSLAVHGGMPFQTDAFRDEVAGLMAELEGGVHACGPYDRSEVGERLREADWVVVPSIWWENAPLVIQEAFQHRRPVLCSDIGGMAEAVRDGVDGLHFKAGDPHSLARAMARAATEPGLWERLVANCPEVPDMALVAAKHLALYAALGRPEAAPLSA